jgi:hypothetical protein
MDMTQTAKFADMTREEQATANLNVPAGVRGQQRDLYLSLTDEQKRIYRRHWFLMGRLAAHCYAKAAKNDPSF